jgi:hypothetical protein
MPTKMLKMVENFSGFNGVLSDGRRYEQARIVVLEDAEPLPIDGEENGESG